MEAQNGAEDRSLVEDALFSTSAWRLLGGIFSMALALLLAGIHSREETTECVPKVETGVAKYWRHPSRNVPKEIQHHALPGDEIVRIRHVFAWVPRFHWETAEFILVRDGMPVFFHRELATPVALHFAVVVVLPLLLGTAFGRLMRWIFWRHAGSEQAPSKDPGMSGWRKGLPYLLTGVAVLLVVCRASMDTSSSSTGAARALVQMTAAQYLLPHEVDGFWIGDVAQLYRWGGIPRRVAEADARPRQALVDRPRPYRDFYFVAMCRFQIFLPCFSGNYCPIRKRRLPPPSRARPPLKGTFGWPVSLRDGRSFAREVACPEGRAA